MRKVLIIEDEQSLREILGEMFKKKGFAVDVAENGLSGLKLVEKNYYDLISVDIMMPVMDGLQFLESVKNSKLKHGKIIVLANLVQEDIIEKSFENGVAGYLCTMEVNLEQVVTNMEDILGGKITREQARERILKISRKYDGINERT